MQPHLTVILVGDDPASQVYVRNKVKACEESGLRSLLERHPATLSEAALLARIEQLNADASIHGILVQMPLPKHIDTDRVLERIDPATGRLDRLGRELLLAAREVEVQRPPRRAGLDEHLVHSSGVQALALEQVRRRLEHRGQVLWAVRAIGVHLDDGVVSLIERPAEAGGDAPLPERLADPPRQDAAQ